MAWWNEFNVTFTDKRRRLHVNKIKYGDNNTNFSQQNTQSTEKNFSGGHVDEIINHQNAAGKQPLPRKHQDDIDIVADKIEAPQQSKQKQQQQQSSEKQQQQQSSEKQQSEKEKSFGGEEKKESKNPDDSLKDTKQSTTKHESVDTEDPGAQDPQTEQQNWDWTEKIDDLFSPEDTKYKNKKPDEKQKITPNKTKIGHGSSETSLVPVEELDAFRNARKLLNAFLHEEDSSSRNHSDDGKINVRDMTKHVITRQFNRLKNDKWVHPKNNNMHVYLDASPSCRHLSTLFMSVAASLINEPGLTIYLNYNGYADPEPIEQPHSRIIDYKESMIWADNIIRSYGRIREPIMRQKYDGSPGIPINEMLNMQKCIPKTILFFGDTDGMTIYITTYTKYQNKCKFVWFCDEKFADQPDICKQFFPWIFNKTLFTGVDDSESFSRVLDIL